VFTLTAQLNSSSRHVNMHSTGSVYSVRTDPAPTDLVSLRPKSHDAKVTNIHTTFSPYRQPQNIEELFMSNVALIG